MQLEDFHPTIGHFYPWIWISVDSLVEAPKTGSEWPSRNAPRRECNKKV